MVRPHYGPPRLVCVVCGASPTIMHSEFDGKPRCATCHIRAVEASKVHEPKARRIR